MMHMRNVLLVAALLAAAAVPARAGFAPDFIGTTAGPGANTGFNYNLIFTTIGAEERLEGAAGAPAPDVINSADFLTIYDVGGFVSATAPAGFTVQTQLVGINGPFTVPPDDSTLTNVTFVYTGADITVSTIFTGALIVSSSSLTNIDYYTSQRTDNEGLNINRKIGEVGTTTVPGGSPVAVPESSSLILAGLGALGLVGATRRCKAAKS